MKRIVCILLTLIMVLSLAVTASAEAPAVECEPLTLVWGDYHSSATTFMTSMEMFRDLCAEKSGGAIVVELYPDSQLGSQLELVEAVRSGDVDITYTSSFANYSPEFSIIDLPFVWDDYAHIERAMFYGELGEILKQTFIEDTGLRIMSWNHAGFRNYYTKNIPVEQIADLKNVKMRSPEQESYILMFECVGAAATPIPFNDTYEAIRSGVVDGVETNIEAYINFSLYEVAPYVIFTNHMYTPECALMNEETYQNLTDTQRQIIEESFAEMMEWFNPNQIALEQELIQKLESEYNCTLFYPDRTELQEACAPVWDLFREKTDMADELIELVEAAHT